MDSSLWTHKYSLGSPGEAALKSGTLEFCGIQPVKISYFAEIRKASDTTINTWFEQEPVKLGEKSCLKKFENVRMWKMCLPAAADEGGRGGEMWQCLEV